MDAKTFADDALLDSRAVARILGLHPGTILRLARAGKLPALKYARHWRFRKEEICAWLSGQVFVPPSPPQPGLRPDDLPGVPRPV